MIKSNEGLTSQKSQSLRSMCNGIGNAAVECGGQTNLSAIRSVVSLFTKNNGIYRSYRHVLHSDAGHIKSIGAKFREFDRSLTQKSSHRR